MEHPDQKFDNTNLKQPMFPAIFVAVDGDMIVYSEAALNNNSLFSPRVFLTAKCPVARTVVLVHVQVLGTMVAILF